VARPRIIPPTRELKKLADAGHSHAEIAKILSDHLGVPIARSTVSAAFHRAGISGNAHRYSEELPWVVRTEHLTQYPARMLRLLGRRRAGLTLRDEESLRLDRWLAILEKDKEVVGYDPNTIEGFWYVPRRGSEGRNGIPTRRQTVDVNELRFGGVDQPRR
jgi:hypothetical protein